MTMPLKSEDILIRALRTPNPKAIKFVVNFPLKKKGNASFKKSQECAQFPLFASLFSLSDIDQIYVFQNQLTLTFKEEILDFESVETNVKAIVQSRGIVHNPDFENDDEKSTKQKVADKPENLLQVEKILDRTIRSGLQADGGDLEVISFEGNKIEISYQGACGGCPSAYMGTLEAIQNILRYELKNENLIVHPVE